MLANLLRRLRQRPAETRHEVADPTVSRGGSAAAGMRPGDRRHWPSESERELAARVGTTAYDPHERST